MRLLISIVAIAALLACQPSDSIDPNSTDSAHTDVHNTSHPAGCGDGLCDTDEDTINCVVDCGSWCGDGACNGQEVKSICPQDCTADSPPPPPKGCGDGICDGEETTVNCVPDCGTWCGDDACNGPEGTALCPQDCGAQGPSDICGDGSCTGDETTANCSQDCGTPPPANVCGDGDCNGGENPANCAQDCSQDFPDATATANPNVHGFMDSVQPEGGGATVHGWSCQLGQEAPIEVHVYAGGDVNSGTFLKAILANASNEQAVNDACQAGGSHRYHLSLSAEQVSAHAGKVIHAYGVSMQGSAPLANSGKFHLPGGAPPINNDVPFDLNAVNWLHINVSNWPVTANMPSVTFQGGSICLNYDKANSWPSVAIPHSSGNGNVDVVANPWVFIQHGGQWYAGTWEWLAVGTTCRNIKAVAGDHIKQPPFGPMDWKPTSGQTLYFMVAGLSRFSHFKNVSERSNIVKVIWP